MHAMKDLVMSGVVTYCLEKDYFIALAEFGLSRNFTVPSIRKILNLGDANDDYPHFGWLKMTGNK